MLTAKLPTTSEIRAGEPLAVAMQMLFRAKTYAEDTRNSRWDYAVEIVEMQRAGVSTSELRWLLTSNYALHALELAPHNGSGRRFQRLNQHALPPGTCFVLSDRGVAMIHRLFLGSNSPDVGRHQDLLRLAIGANGRACSNHVTDEHAAPIWDGRRRQLCFRNLIVKQFRCRARNQETIIAAFQEDQWAARIDDPLPQGGRRDSRRRLHDTIKSLNRKQVNCLIRFRSDGSGSGILWQSR